MSHNVETIEYKGCRIRLEVDEDPGSPREWCNVGTMVCWHRRYNLGDEQPREEPLEWAAGMVLQKRVTEAAEARKEKALLKLREENPGAEDEFLALGHQRGDAIYSSEKRPTAESLRLALAWAEGAEAAQEAYDDFDSEEMTSEEVWTALEKDYVILPLYLYDHSGISMSTGAFSCPWDSGRVGYIYVSLEDAKKEWISTTPESWDSLVPSKKWTGSPWGKDPVEPEEVKITLRQWAEEALRGEVETYTAFLEGLVVGFVTEYLEEGGDPDDDDSWEHIDSCWGFYPKSLKGRRDYDYCLCQAEESIDNWLKEQDEQKIAETANNCGGEI